MNPAAAEQDARKRETQAATDTWRKRRPGIAGKSSLLETPVSSLFELPAWNPRASQFQSLARSVDFSGCRCCARRELAGGSCGHL